MPITPNTVVHLLSVPLENNYKNQIRFLTREEQTEYMLRKIATDTESYHLTFTDFTYQRKDNIIRIPKHVDELINANYVMYQNDTYRDRWFYAFITSMEYVNDGLTFVHIETDVWQTWFDRITLKESFVEREHVPKYLDGPGNYLIDEGLETGEFICSASYENSELNNLLRNNKLIVASTHAPTLYDESENGGMTAININEEVDSYINGVYSGCGYFAFDRDDVIDGYERGVRSFLKELAKNQKIDAVVGLFVAPLLVLNLSEKYESYHSADDENYFNYYKVTDSNSANGVDVNITFDKEYLGTHKVRNKKLLTSPYHYLYVSNNAGGSAIYNYEDFETFTEENEYNQIETYIKFMVRGSLTPGCSIRLIPYSYKGATENNEHGLNLGKFPICCYSVDMYTNWLTQNAVNMNIDIAENTVGNTLKLASNLMTGNGMSATGNLANIFFNVASVMNRNTVASRMPNEARGNLNSGDVTFSMGKTTFTFYDMMIKPEMAEIIDDYFDMFGYKINKVKIPNIFSRAKWNFIKTVGLNLDGKAPQEDLDKIRQIFDNGITFWSKDTDIEDYSNPETNI